MATLWPIGNQDADNMMAYKGAEAIVLDTPFKYISRGIYVGVGGDVSLKLRCGDTVIYKAVPAGLFSLYEQNAILVTSVNTTATNLVALYS